MLIESIVLAVILGFLTGGKLNPLLELHLKKGGLLFLGAALQAIAFGSIRWNLDLGPHWVIPVLHSFSYFILLAFIGVNRSFSGMPFVALGIFLNALVISLNGGLMPVEPTFIPEASRQLLELGTGTHGILSEGTRLTLLADNFYADIPRLGKQLFSAGDLFIDLGMGIFIIKQMRIEKNELKGKLSR
jgi:hypothetical protein